MSEKKICSQKHNHKPHCATKTPCPPTFWGIEKKLNKKKTTKTKLIIIIIIPCANRP